MAFLFVDTRKMNKSLTGIPGGPGGPGGPGRPRGPIVPYCPGSPLSPFSLLPSWARCGSCGRMVVVKKHMQGHKRSWHKPNTEIQKHAQVHLLSTKLRYQSFPSISSSPFNNFLLSSRSRYIRIVKLFVVNFVTRLQVRGNIASCIHMPLTKFLASSFALTVIIRRVPICGKTGKLFSSILEKQNQLAFFYSIKANVFQVAESHVCTKHYVKNAVTKPDQQ